MKNRRNRRIRGRPDPQLLAASCLVAAVYISIVFLIGASKTGSWAARTVFAPMFGIPAGIELNREDGGSLILDAASSTPVTEAAKPETVRIDLPERVWYSLQMGVYADRNNAESQARSLQALGAGGYILTDGAQYRVLAAVYQDAESLNKVKAQLASEGVESTLHCIVLTGCSLSITAGAEEIDAYREAIVGTSETCALLTEQALGFDRLGSTAAEGIALSISTRTSLAKKRAAFQNAVSTPTDVSDAVLSFYDSLTVFLDDTASRQDAGTAEISSALKYAAILAAELAAGMYRTVASA